MRQALGPGALGRHGGSGWRGRWEGGSGWGRHVNSRPFHFNVWQNSLQIKKKKEKKSLFLMWTLISQKQEWTTLMTFKRIVLLIKGKYCYYWTSHAGTSEELKFLILFSQEEGDVAKFLACLKYEFKTSNVQFLQLVLWHSKGNLMLNVKKKLTSWKVTDLKSTKA